MGLTTAMYTGLSGINVNQQRIDTIGNNIANVNTTAFKGSRTLFQTQFSQTYSMGNAPSATSGGVNPTQVGLGALVGATQRNFISGSLETTGINSDLAIEGNGLFVLQRANGQRVYTRDGSFSVNADNQLVTQNGDYVQGFGVDGSFNVVPGVLTNITVPLGSLSLARPTESVVMDGDLSAAGTIATQGSLLRSQALVDGSGAAATAATALSDLRSATNPTVPLFADGNTVRVSGISRGDRDIQSQSFVVGTDGSTFGDFADWLESALAINSAAVPADAGVTVDGGTLLIRGNAGEQNALVISPNDIFSDNTAVALPFSFDEELTANGSGVFTAFTVYDSLGNPVIVNATFALESTPATGPVWRFYLEAPDADGIPRPLGTGTVSFDVNGNFVSASSDRFTIDRSSAGAAPLAFQMDFSSIHGLSTRTSNVILGEQDGFPPGTLVNFAVGKDGTVNGVFSNGLTRTLGQVALAVVPNPAGLIAEANNNYLVGPNSGEPVITAPGTANAGQILGGALELSNVDLSREFIGLITSSTGFQASSRVISTSADLLDQLLLIVR